MTLWYSREVTAVRQGYGRAMEEMCQMSNVWHVEMNGGH